MDLIRQHRIGRVILFAVAAAAVYATQLAIDHARRDQQPAGELMYFPSTQFTQVAACGFDNLVGDYIWLDIIQYYGRHKLGDMQYRYLGHMLDVLTILEPRFAETYKFGSLLLISDAGDATGAFRLLDRGMQNLPEDWTIPFTRGFFNYVFIRDYREAGRWFRISSKLPGASETAGRFAAFALQKGEDLVSSRELWLELYQKTKNQAERELARYYIAKIDREMIIERLQAIVQDYHHTRGILPPSLYALVATGYLRYVPDDPLGGRFTLESSTGKVKVIGGRKL
jgi:hypothetical protein